MLRTAVVKPAATAWGGAALVVAGQAARVPASDLWDASHAAVPASAARRLMAGVVSGGGRMIFGAAGTSKPLLVGRTRISRGTYW